MQSADSSDSRQAQAKPRVLNQVRQVRAGGVDLVSRQEERVAHDNMQRLGRRVGARLHALRPEDQLLLACARTNIDAATAARIAALAQTDLDWEHLLRRARWHGLTPLLNQSLARICPNSLPPGALEQLCSHAFAVAGRNLRLTDALLEILAVFETHDISAIPVKGPVVATAAYGDLALRQFHDLDILIHRHDFFPAKALLMAAGYRPMLELDRMREHALLHQQHDYPFVHPDGGIVVDLQWGMMQLPFPFPRDPSYWERVEIVTIANAPVCSLSPEDMLVFLCVHGAKHLWQRLSWVCDVAELIGRRADLNWAHLLTTARSQGVERMLLLGLFIAQNLLESPVPRELVQRATITAGVPAVAVELVDALFQGDERQEHVAEATPLVYLRMIERWQDRVRFAWRLLPALRHPLALLHRYGTRLLHRSRRPTASRRER